MEPAETENCPVKFRGIKILNFHRAVFACGIPEAKEQNDTSDLGTGGLIRKPESFVFLSGSCLSGHIFNETRAC